MKKIIIVYTILISCILSPVVAQNDCQDIGAGPQGYDTGYISGNPVRTENGSHTRSLEYYTARGCDNVLDKYVIIIEGFDPIDEIGLAKFEEVFAPSRKIFNEHGYEVVYVNFHNGGDYLENNTALIKKLIREINATKSANHENIVVGVSMGGLIGRMALKEMEDANEDHETKLFFSIDAPQTGANIPVGFQLLVKKLHEFLNSRDQYKENAKDQISNLQKSLDKINSPAARQMLEYHYGETPDPLFTQLQSRLHKTYYPTKCRKIAISNGSINTNQAGVSSGSLLFEADFVEIRGGNTKWVPDFWVLKLKAKVWAEPEYSSGKTYELKIESRFFSKDSKTHTNQCTFDRSYSHLAGGQFKSQKAFTDAGFGKATDLDYHCFVPTQSAFGIQVEKVDMTQGQTYYQQNKAQEWHDLLLSLSPFDQIYYDNENPTRNGEHTFALRDQIDGIPRYQDELSEIMFREMMISETRLQNKVFAGNTTHTAYSKIRVSGEMSQNNEGDLWNTDRNGSVEFSTTSNTTLIAKNKISFTPGVRIRNGAKLSATINPCLSICSANNAVLNVGSPSSRITLEDFSDSDVNQDAELKDIVLYPNPTFGVFYVELPEIEEGTLIVFNNEGNKMDEINFGGKNTIEVDISEFPRGIYVVQVITGSSFVTSKVVLE